MSHFSELTGALQFIQWLPTVGTIVTPCGSKLTGLPQLAGTSHRDLH